MLRWPNQLEKWALINKFLPNKKRSANRDKIESYYMLIVSAAIDVVDYVFEDDSKIIDGEKRG